MGFLVFYRYKPMTKEEAKRSSDEWDEFKKESTNGAKITGEYDHAHGTDWNGFFIVESEDMETFQEFWEKCRDATRWYIESMEVVIGFKR